MKLRKRTGMGANPAFRKLLTEKQDQGALRRKEVFEKLEALAPDLSGLYATSRALLTHRIGEAELRRYNDRPVSLIVSAFPGHPWLVWKFKTLNSHSWFAQLGNGIGVGDPVAQAIGREFVQSLHTLAAQGRDPAPPLSALAIGTLNRTDSQRILKMGGLQRVLKSLGEGNLPPQTLSSPPRHRLVSFDSINAISLQSALKAEFPRLEDLYSLDRTRFERITGVKYPAPLKCFQVVSRIFPNEQWQEVRFRDFGPTAAEFASRPELRADFFAQLLSLLGGSLDAFYQQADEKFFDSHGGRGLTQLFGGYASVAIMLAYPQHQWDVYRFKRPPPSNWQLRWANGKESVAKSLRTRVESLEDLYFITPSFFRSEIEVRYLAEHEGCVGTAVANLYPDHQWVPWRFAVAPRNLWTSPKTRRAFLDTFVKDRVEVQYKLSSAQVKAAGGTILLDYFDESVIDLVKVEYPEVGWQAWGWERAPRGWWQALQAQFPSISPYPDPTSHTLAVLEAAILDPVVEAVVRTYIDQLAERHGIARLEDWYRLSQEQIDPGVASHLNQLGKLPNILQWLYPSHDWELFQFGSAGKKAAQRFLLRFLSGLFAEYNILEEATPERLEFKNYGARSREEVAGVRFDIALPELRLVIEYNGMHHYTKTYLSSDVKAYSTRDALKKELCELNSFTLLVVPFWWDKTVDSLINSIHKVRGDIVPFPVGDALAIPAQPPAKNAELSK